MDDFVRGFGYIPDIPKIEDYTEDHPEIHPLLKATKVAKLPREPKSGYRPLGAATATLPSIAQAVDLRNFCSTIEDQGQLGSCTAN
jgi:hypothetical protein